MYCPDLIGTVHGFTPPAFWVILSANWFTLSLSNVLAQWDDFRTANWSEIVEHPELTLQLNSRIVGQFHLIHPTLRVNYDFAPLM